MPRIMIKCPTTGQDVATGMSSPDQKSFDENEIFDHVLKFCGACDGDHPWDKESAHLEG